MILLKFFFFLGVQCSETDPGEGRQDKDEGEGKGVAEVCETMTLWLTHYSMTI